MIKWLVYIMLFTLPLAACGKKAPSTAKKETFEVAGNCGMCKKTIEKSVKLTGVIEASWDKKTKLMTVVYDTTLISMDQIKRKIADAGYDNDLYKANQEDYDGLHECCKYDREK